MKLGPRKPSTASTAVVTVTTLKDSLANVERFVRRNLAAGADHMLVFVEGGDEEVLQFLAEHPHTTRVNTGKGYWGGNRPKNLNLRQVVNANRAVTALSVMPWAGWAFHIDGDEVLDIDRSFLLATHDDTVRLSTLEAVSQYHWDDGEVTHFKRPLTEDELLLLHALDVIDKPKMSAYFRGHLSGKGGVRPSLRSFLGVHKGWVEDDSTEVEALPGMHVLHYDSFSGEEFVRKWLQLLNQNVGTGFRSRRDQVRGAVQAVVDRPDLPPATAEKYLGLIYRRLIEDDLPTLRELGLLVEVPRPSHRPATIPDDELRHLRHFLRWLGGTDYRVFLRRPDVTAAELTREQLLTNGLAEIQELDPVVAERLQSLLVPPQP